VELVVSILAIDQSFLPATAHLADIDPACALNHVANTPVFGHPIEHALSFSAGFGGTNAALIVSREQKLPQKKKVCLQ
jgi:3-oxoacyl-(acyl-carrier-protein) synthase